MDLRRLRTFVVVAEQGTVSSAATTLRITQPALSRQLQDLQAEFGVRLFDHVGRRLRLTAEGAELVPTCRGRLLGGKADGICRLPAAAGQTSGCLQSHRRLLIREEGRGTRPRRRALASSSAGIWHAEVV